MDNHYDALVHYYFSYFRYTTLETPWIENMFIANKWFDQTQIARNIYNDNMYLGGFLDYNFWLVNNWTKIVTWVFYFVFMLFFVTLEFIVVHCSGCKSPVLTNIKSMFFFSGTTLFVFLCFYPWGFTAIAEIRNV